MATDYTLKKYWMIECAQRGYHTGCFLTQAEARYRLNEMATEPFYTCGLPTVRRADDFFALSDGAEFRIVHPVFITIR